MPVSLTKGGNVSLQKMAPGLKKIFVGLGWEAREPKGAAFDLDASVFLMTAADKVRDDQDFVFYNNARSADGTVEHTGDNRTGAGDGDDEAIRVDLDRLPPEITKLVVAVTIHEAARRWQNFGMIQSAYIRVVNDDADGNQQEIARYDLSGDGGMEVAMIFGEIYRSAGEWKFRAVGQGFRGGLKAMAASFGVDV